MREKVINILKDFRCYCNKTMSSPNLQEAADQILSELTMGEEEIEEAIKDIYLQKIYTDKPHGLSDEDIQIFAHFLLHKIPKGEDILQADEVTLAFLRKYVGIPNATLEELCQEIIRLREIPKGGNSKFIDIVVDADGDNNLLSPILIGKQEIKTLGIYVENDVRFWVIRKNYKTSPQAKKKYPCGFCGQSHDVPFHPMPEIEVAKKIEPLEVSNNDETLYRVLAKKINELIADRNGRRE